MDHDLGPLVAALAGLGVRRVHSYAWRDLDDPEAGGSEVHADEVERRWAAAGLVVHHRTSTFDRSRTLSRNGYTVRQAGGRVSAQLRTPLHGLLRDRRRADAVVDIWNGVPWWSPLWFPGPRVTWLHHVHGPMWEQSFPRPVAAVGRTLEARVAPRIYRRERIVTLSASSYGEIVGLGFSPSQVSIVEPGVDDRFVPDPVRRSPVPLVVAVGRVAPVKRYLDLMAAVAEARRELPGLLLEIVGDGPQMPDLRRWVADHHAAAWCTLRGHVADDELVDAYQRAWVVAGASLAEGWGMSLTEGAACGTPAVATRIAGHTDAVADGLSGVLVDDPAAIAPALVGVIGDQHMLERLSAGALAHSATFSWDRCAHRHLTELLAVTARRQGVVVDVGDDAVAGDVPSERGGTGTDTSTA